MEGDQCCLEPVSRLSFYLYLLPFPVLPFRKYLSPGNQLINSLYTKLCFRVYFPGKATCNRPLCQKDRSISNAPTCCENKCVLLTWRLFKQHLYNGRLGFSLFQLQGSLIQWKITRCQLLRSLHLYLSILLR